MNNAECPPYPSEESRWIRVGDMLVQLDDIIRVAEYNCFADSESVPFTRIHFRKGGNAQLPGCSKDVIRYLNGIQGTKIPEVCLMRALEKDEAELKKQREGGTPDDASTGQDDTA